MPLAPKTAATLAKIAIQAANDDETRNKIIFISLAPIISVLLILAFIVYVLTNSIEMTGTFFTVNELNVVKNIRSQYGYEQLINTKDNSYVESSGLNFSGVSFKDGATEVVYYNQADERWKDKSYGRTGTIGRSGCGPTSLSIVISSLTDKKVDPVQMSKWAYENGYYCEGAGSYHTLISAGAKQFGLKVEGCSSNEPQRIVDALSQGKLVIAIMAKGHFTRNGHFIVLRGVTLDKKILVADPVSRTRSEEKWDLSIILDEANKGADAGGPFWIISK
ncbi:MAG: C39 family peptidase [Clostridium sp.]|uniref:C39 family peptidase n=1 Tax=Clostridium sp. TaxID=1506 RepID=UPI0039EA0B91